MRPLIRSGIVLVLAVSAVGAGIVALHAFRQPLLESWYLRGFDAAASPEKRDKIAGLAKHGGERAAVRLVRALEEEGPREEALDALLDIVPRLAAPSKRAVAAALVERFAARGEMAPIAASRGRNRDILLRTIVAAGELDAVVLSELFGRLRSPSLVVQDAIAWAIVKSASSAQAAALDDLLAGATPQDIVALLLPSAMPFRGGRGLAASVASQQEGRALASRIAASHADERIRALAASFVVPRDRGGPRFTYDLAFLIELYERDPSLLVKTAAVRIAGYLGSRPGTLDLPRLLLTAEDPKLLTEIIQARTLWTLDRAFGGVELWDGFLCEWIPGGGVSRQDRLSWRTEEIDRLSRLLDTSRVAMLRDAASLALASRYHGIEDAKDSAPEPVVAPDLVVHEWSVWQEGDGTLMPAAFVLDGLPDFVHRSRVRAADIVNGRLVDGNSLDVFRPVVYFHTPRPLSVLVRVGFHAGRPWTYFPHATDHTHDPEATPPTRESARPRRSPRSPKTRATSGEVENESRVSTALADRDGISPPWVERSEAGSPPPYDFERRPDPWALGPAALRPFYETAPWVQQRQPRFGDALASIGLEWCGLRLGYPAELEPAPPRAAADSWWPLLRAGPAARVAVRGDSEGFLFYDGAVAMPGPVDVAWSDESRSELVIAVRPFDAYPDEPSAEETARRWWLSKADRERLRATAPLPAVFVLSRKAGEPLRGTVFEDRMPAESGGAPAKARWADLELAEDELRRRFAAIVERQGLEAAETEALARTCERELFLSPGLRVVTVLPQWIYDALLPMEIFPVPGSTVRVGVVLRHCEEMARGPRARQ